MIDDLADAISYTPTGTVAARVTEGSGKAILFYPNGNKNWEMTYEGFNRTGCLHFDEDGTLRRHRILRTGRRTANNQ